jgi:transmembrane sensor
MNINPDNTRIALLARKWEEGTITPEEKLEFNEWYNQQQHDIEIDNTESAIGEQLYANITSAVKTRSLTKLIIIKRISAAAAILITLSAGLYFYFTYNTHPTTVATIQYPDQIEKIKPGTDGAILTIGNGKEILLDGSDDGNLSVGLNANAVKKDNELIYTEGNDVPDVMNTMRTPRGKQYRLTLSDGTRVWLNAASSITYPVAFNASTRTIEITGEAFFEVAGNKLKPFIVNTQNQSITVLGTSFNINAYPEDEQIKTTLMTGAVSVKVNNSDNSNILKPGQQAELIAGKLIVNNADTAKVTAWKRGMFEFNNTSLPELMKQISRWYDVDVRFEGKIPDRRMGGGISKYLSLEKVLNILRKSKINFRYEKGVLIVTA